ncbi:cysteine desulfurase family protein [Haematomicrobium sanguinis]|uniref:cysteine desulfurase family protein n=1 Tax=Haematomicrobium sanguinis TaxID=479106 RepID=UPI00047ACB1C|nr:cysteine desulfurase family protein [Haematomicrobium sanguinis]
MIYLDAAATREVDLEVLEFVAPLLRHDFGNPSSVHELGQSARRALEYGRDMVAGATGGQHPVLFTSGGTEANNLALKGVTLPRWLERGRTGETLNVLVGATEHSSIVEAARYLERFHGIEVRRVPVDRAGVIDLAALSLLLDEHTAVCAVGLANNEVGTVQDTVAMSVLCRAVGAHFHVDAVQAAGVMDIDLDAVGADSLSISGHKVGAPKGIGALVSRAGVRIEPLIHGGGQERGVRSGTENVAFAVALGLALARAGEHREEHAARLSRFRDYLIEALTAGVPGMEVTGHRTQRLPGHASFVNALVSGESALIELERAGVLASSGSACAAGRSDPSAVLLAMGYSAESAQTALRFTIDSTVSEAAMTRAARDAVSTMARLIGEIRA